MFYTGNLIRVECILSGDIGSSGYDGMYFKVPGAPGTYCVEGVVLPTSRFPQWNGHLILSQKDEAKIPLYFSGYAILTLSLIELF